MLLWILRKLPPLCFQDLCRESGLTLHDVTNEYPFYAQLVLENSRPDALLEFARNKFLIVETKRFPNALKRSQFEFHITGAAKRFNDSNCWFLFISGDSQEPPDLSEFRSKYGDRIGFMSWKSLLALFDGWKKRLERPYSILLDEFLIFARYHRLGKLTDMNTDETKAFLAAYPTVNRYQEAAKEKFTKVLADVTRRVICDCEERATANNDVQTDLPCLYLSLDVKGWHIPNLSIFIFLNILTKQIGVVGNGYQNSKEKQDFLPLWNGQFKQTFRDDPQLHAFTWIDDNGDDEDEAECFKLIAGTSGKLFDPATLDVFKDYFYWGYSYPFDIDALAEPLFAKIASDASKLVASFTPKKFKRG